MCLGIFRRSKRLPLPPTLSLQIGATHGPLSTASSPTSSDRHCQSAASNQVFQDLTSYAIKYYPVPPRVGYCGLFRPECSGLYTLTDKWQLARMRLDSLTSEAGRRLLHRDSFFSNAGRAIYLATTHWPSCEHDFTQPSRATTLSTCQGAVTPPQAECLITDRVTTTRYPPRREGQTARLANGAPSRMTSSVITVWNLPSQLQGPSASRSERSSKPIHSRNALET